MIDSNGNSAERAGSGASTQHRALFDQKPLGICRSDEEGFLVVDGLAGRASVFGFGSEPVLNAITEGAAQYLGDASAFAEQTVGADSLTPLFRELCGKAQTPDSVLLCTSADMAVDTTIRLARTSGGESRFRTIALIGSDHGRSGMCRTASGQPELRVGFGPMMAGFVHVPPNDLDALCEAINDQTACILISPLALQCGLRPIETNYLSGVRNLCDEHGLLLAIDETQIPFGTCGTALAFSSIAEVHADLVALSAGLFAGLPGGLVLAKGEIAEHAAVPSRLGSLPAEVAGRTLAEMVARGLPHSAAEAMRGFAEMLALRVSQFEFVRDVHAIGMAFGIEMDMPSDQFVAAAGRVGLRIAQAGTTSFMLQLPLTIGDADRELLLTRIDDAMNTAARTTAGGFTEDLAAAEPGSVETGV